MKNALLILNVILLIAVGVLFYWHFQSGKTTGSLTGHSKNDSLSNTSSGNFKIAYFEMDSLDQNFQMMKDVRDSLNKKEEYINAEMTRMRQEYQNKYNEYQSQAATMTPAQQEQAGKDLMERQGRINDREQALKQGYQDFFSTRQNEIKSLVESFLKEYNKDHKYNFIISSEPGFMYYKDTAYNITVDVVKGLNEMYKKKKKQS